MVHGMLFCRSFFPAIVLVQLIAMMQAFTSRVHLTRKIELHGLRFSIAGFAKQKGTSDGGKISKKSNTAFVSIEYVDSELWKLEPIIDILRKGCNSKTSSKFLIFKICGHVTIWRHHTLTSTIVWQEELA